MSLITEKPTIAESPSLLAQQALAQLRDRLNFVLRGKERVIEHILACLLSRGHLLLEDLPGLGKTTVARALAQALGGEFTRVQCTPDLLPTDLTGYSFYNQKDKEFEFRPGPLFSDIVLMDEINRATPRTQSALLEAMAENQVTVEGIHRPLSKTFMVIATQNPIEHEGTFELPEAQLDRFSMKLSIGYADRMHERLMLKGQSNDAKQNPAGDIPVMSLEQLTALQQEVASVFVHDCVDEYLLDLAHATREHAGVEVGLSPRGMLIWRKLAQAWAYLHRRDYVTPADLQDVALPLLTIHVFGNNNRLPETIEQILKTVPVPVYPQKGKIS